MGCKNWRDITTGMLCLYLHIYSVTFSRFSVCLIANFVLLHDNSQVVIFGIQNTLKEMHVDIQKAIHNFGDWCCHLVKKLTLILLAINNPRSSPPLCIYHS
jgi:hypothetical protein